MADRHTSHRARAQANGHALAAPRVPLRAACTTYTDRLTVTCQTASGSLHFITNTTDGLDRIGDWA